MGESIPFYFTGFIWTISVLSSGNVDKYGILLAKQSYNQKIWIFAIEQCVEKANWPCKKSIQSYNLLKD